MSVQDRNLYTESFNFKNKDEINNSPSIKLNLEKIPEKLNTYNLNSGILKSIHIENQNLDNVKSISLRIQKTQHIQIPTEYINYLREKQNNPEYINLTELLFDNMILYKFDESNVANSKDNYELEILLYNRDTIPNIYQINKDNNEIYNKFFENKHIINDVGYIMVCNGKCHYNVFKQISFKPNKNFKLIEKLTDNMILLTNYNTTFVEKLDEGYEYVVIGIGYSD